MIVNAPHPGIFARELAHNQAQQKASHPDTPEQSLSAGNYAGAFTEEYGLAVAAKADIEKTREQALNLE